MVTGSQLRAARGLLNISVAELAHRTGLALNTIRKAEATNGPVTITAGNSALLVSTLETEGVIFIPADIVGPGVRLRHPVNLPDRRRRRSN